MSEIRFLAHSPKQEQALFSEKRIVLVGAGTQWGKTQVGAHRMKRKLAQFTGKEDAFIITSPNYKTLMQSTLPAFLKIMGGWGDYNKKDDVFRMKEGGIVYCRTETDPDSVIGITNVRHIWGDEAGKYRLYFWENLQARADYCGCGIDLTTSPYSLNWIYKELIKPHREGKRADLEVVQAASWENPTHSLADPQKLAEKRATMDPRRFDMIYGGQWGRMGGLVYDCWDEYQNVCRPFRLPNGTRMVAGIDWGFNPDPFVCVVRAILPDGSHYQVSEFYKTGMTLTDMVQYCRQAQRTWGIRQFFCDPCQPGSIEEFNRNGLGAVPADNDIDRGVSLHYEMIKLRRYKIFEGSSPQTLDELETYHYPEPKDYGPDQDSKQQKPVGQNDHCLDANRYVTLETYRQGHWVPKVISEEPKAETQSRRIEKLKTNPLKRNAHTEKWEN